MDWVSITIGCSSVSNSIAKVSPDLGRFIREVRDSRAELTALSAELRALDVVLDLLKDDAMSKAFPTDMALPAPAVIDGVGRLVGMLETLFADRPDDRPPSHLPSYLFSDVDGKTSGRPRWLAMRRLIEQSRGAVEVYHLTLGLALDLVALNVQLEAKPSAASRAYAERRNDLAARAREVDRVRAEVSRLQSRLRGDLFDTDAAFTLRNYVNILQRYANATTADPTTTAGALGTFPASPTFPMPPPALSARSASSAYSTGAGTPPPPIGRSPDSAVDILDDKAARDRRAHDTIHDIHDLIDELHGTMPGRAISPLPKASSLLSVPSPLPSPRGASHGGRNSSVLSFHDRDGNDDEEDNDEVMSGTTARGSLSPVQHSVQSFSEQSVSTKKTVVKPATESPKSKPNGTAAAGAPTIRDHRRFLAAPTVPAVPAVPVVLAVPKASTTGRARSSTFRSLHRGTGAAVLPTVTAAAASTSNSPAAAGTSSSGRSRRFSWLLRHMRTESPSATATAAATIVVDANVDGEADLAARRPSTATGHTPSIFSAVSPTHGSSIYSSSINSSVADGIGGADVDKHGGRRFFGSLKKSRMVTAADGHHHSHGNATTTPRSALAPTPPPPPPPAPADAVFGVSLRQSIRVAGSSARTHHTGSEDASRREFPLCMAKCERYIRSVGGVATPDIFGGGVQADHAGTETDDKESTEAEGKDDGPHDGLLALRRTFATGPDYGAGLDLGAAGFSRHDAAALMLQFLAELPQPLVSEAVARRWVVLSRQAAVAPRPHARRLDQCIDFWEEALSGVRGAARPLLKLLLNLWADVADAADRNDMTAERLAGRVLRPLLHLDGTCYATDLELGLAFVIRKRSEYAQLLRGDGAQA